MSFAFNPLYGTLDLVNEGDVVGPDGATDKAISRYDGTTGKLIQDSKAIVQDGGAIQAQGFLTKRAVDGAVVVPSGYSWIAPSIELEDTGSIEIDDDAELIVE